MPYTHTHTLTRTSKANNQEAVKWQNKWKKEASPMNDGANTTTTTATISPFFSLSNSCAVLPLSISLFLLPKLSTRIQIRVLRLLQQQQLEPPNYLQTFSTK